MSNKKLQDEIRQILKDAEGWAYAYLKVATGNDGNTMLLEFDVNSEGIEVDTGYNIVPLQYMVEYCNYTVLGVVLEYHNKVEIEIEGVYDAE